MKQLLVALLCLVIALGGWGRGKAGAQAKPDRGSKNEN